MTVYIFPVLCLASICVFFAALPNLKKYPAIRPEADEKKLTLKKDGLLLLLLTVFTAFISYRGLGSNTAPSTFCDFSEGEVILEAESDFSVSKLMVYSRIGIGTVSVDVSSDGKTWMNVAEYDQDYCNILKWHRFDYSSPVSGRYVRVSVTGEPQIGEIGLFTSGDELIEFSGSSVLTDEQDVVPEDSTYLNSSYFDEIYHVRTAIENINNIKPYEISHPPLGKIIISLGIRLFGENPFGWRFMGVLFGVLLVPLFYILCKKIFGGCFIPFTASLIVATDFMRFVQTRLATVDTYAVFFITLMYLFMYLYVTENRLSSLALCGVFFGIGCACKWTCVYAGVGLAVIWVLKRIALRKEGFASFAKNSLFCIAFFIIVPGIIYYLSYIPYGTANGMSGIGMLFSKDYASIVIENQKYMFSYHSGIVATHPYSSRWYQWILDIRPILYYLQYYSDGTKSSFGAFVNPVLCWGGLISLIILGYCAVVRKDNSAAFIVIGYLSQLLPWVLISRLTFEYHYFPSTVFLALSLAWCMNVIYKRSAYGKMFCITLTALSACLFVVFYPVLSGTNINAELSSALYQWLPSWPF